MIPQFPTFKKLELSDKNQIDSIISKYPPYSDYIFSSLWAWDVNKDLEISILNENLITKTRDYITGEVFLAFLGNKNIGETSSSLIEYSKTNYGNATLKLIPNHNFISSEVTLLSEKYEVLEDRNNFDYILNTDETSTLSGLKYANKKNKLNYFNKNYTPITKFIESNFLEIHQDIKDLTNQWSNAKKQQKKSNIINQIEIAAIDRLIIDGHNFNIIIFSVYINNKLSGFAIFEIIDKDHAVIGFQKADLSFKGINEFIISQVSKYLFEKNVKNLNIEQDLGIEGLRISKMDYNPKFFIKHTIKEK